MKNIIFITSSIDFAGASKMLCFVAESLALRGYNVRILNLNSAKDVSGYRRSLSDAIGLWDIAQGSPMKRLKQIVRISREADADVIIGFTGYPNMFARLTGWCLGIPSIMSERGDPKYTCQGKGLKSKLALRIINCSSGGVFQTPGAMEFYGKRLQKRGVVIPNPIFIKGEIPRVEQSQREKTVVSVGRLDNFQKRYDVMLKAFKLFSEKYPEYILKLYGRGNDEDLIEEWVETMGLSAKVRFMGLTTQPMQDIAADGIFLITSDYEGISNSLLEAMAVGLPCVSTDHSPGGARLLITDHENGLLAPVEDAEGLADALCEFAEDPALAEKCGQNARQVLERFAPERIIDQWEALITKMTSRGV